jgi:type I restriction enzyme M protein
MQLIDASALRQKMRKSLGSKRKEMGEEDIAAVTRLFGDAAEADLATITDAAGKATRVIVPAAEATPVAPKDGKVKLAPLSRHVRTRVFGSRSITVERPLRDAVPWLTYSSHGGSMTVERGRHTFAVEIAQESGRFRADDLQCGQAAWRVHLFGPL